MRYLITNDYYTFIQSTQLTALIQNNVTRLLKSESTAIEEAQSYLKQKFDVLSEFTDTSVWVNTKTYNANDRIVIDFPAWATGVSYSIGDTVINSGTGYRCKTANNDATFTANKWDSFGPQYSLYYAQLPVSLFTIDGNYNKGDQVYWKGKKYTCVIATQSLDQDSAIQYYQYKNIPSKNVFPDDNVYGKQFWGTGITYSVPAGTLPTNATYWTLGDNRSQQMVMMTIDMTLYHLHKAIAPMNIPDIRVKAYDDAISWLKKAAKGEITPNLTALQPRQGSRIRYGGNVKNINSY